MTNGSDTLQDKVVLITGGTTGLGFATAQELLAQGAKVAITGRDRAKVDEAVSRLGAAASGAVADVAKLEDLDALAQTVKERHGRVDVLFANAGHGVFGPIEAIDEAAYDRQFDANVKGVFFTVQKILPLIPAGGSIVLTASAVHEKGMPAGSIYFATKAAVRSFARSLAAELGPRGIRVNTVSPGIVRTAFQEKVNIPDEAMEGFIRTVVAEAPLGREGKPEDIAKAVAYLASPAAAYVTAADLVVDGGWMNV